MGRRRRRRCRRHGHPAHVCIRDRGHHQDVRRGRGPAPGLRGEDRPRRAGDPVRDPAVRDERRHDPAAGHDDERVPRSARRSPERAGPEGPGSRVDRRGDRHSRQGPAAAGDRRWSRQVQRAQLLRARDGHREGDRRAAGNRAAPRPPRARRAGPDLDAGRRAAAAAADRGRRPHRRQGRRPGQRLPAVACLGLHGAGRGRHGRRRAEPGALGLPALRRPHHRRRPGRDDDHQGRRNRRMAPTASGP